MLAHPAHQPSRRAIAKGAAWTVPAIAMATAAPAVAASTCAGCHTMEWSQFALGETPTTGTTTPSDVECATPFPVTIKTSATGNPGTVNPRTNTASTGFYSEAFNMKVGYQGEQAGRDLSRPFSIAGVSAEAPGLILNIGHNTTTKVEFTFPAPVSSVSLDVYDFTRSTADPHYR
ncbi:hypothetical protein [Kytococcus sedentarius]|uniref:hypothetical protein n=1 Tax=Kytococcus sedentarius TaxID=1276 RepID=UPI0035BC0E24